MSTAGRRQNSHQRLGGGRDVGAGEVKESVVRIEGEESDDDEFEEGTKTQSGFQVKQRRAMSSTGAGTRTSEVLRNQKKHFTQVWDGKRGVDSDGKG